MGSQHVVIGLVRGCAALGLGAWLTVAAPASAHAQEALPPSPYQGGLFQALSARSLVPGVERSINPNRVFLDPTIEIKDQGGKSLSPRNLFSELTSRHDVPELLQVDDKFDWAKDAEYRHQVWALEFTFKPIRFIDVDVPAPGGKLQQKRLWYMVYRVRNNGTLYRVTPTKYEDPNYRIEPVAGEPFKYEVLGKDKLDQFRDGAFYNDNKPDHLKTPLENPIRFVPTFLLYARDLDIGKKYLDRVIPAAIKPISIREDVARFTKEPLLDTVAIAGDIRVSPPDQDRSVWGVVTWEDIDPRTDFFSIYIKGLTNASFRQYITGRGWWYAEKTLRLDFTRLGDEFHEDEEEIRFKEARWVYLDANWAAKHTDAEAASPTPLVQP